MLALVRAFLDPMQSSRLGSPSRRFLDKSKRASLIEALIQSAFHHMNMGLPLEGLRVIDLTQDFAGPFCTMILSDLGAEVIKIEKPGGGEETRAWGPPFVDGISYYFLSLNRGKKSVVLDLKTREAQKIIQKLVVDSDIFVESSRPGQMV